MCILVCTCGLGRVRLLTEYTCVPAVYEHVSTCLCEATGLPAETLRDTEGPRHSGLLPTQSLLLPDPETRSQSLLTLGVRSPRVVPEEDNPGTPVSPQKAARPGGDRRPTVSHQTFPQPHHLPCWITDLGCQERAMPRCSAHPWRPGYAQGHRMLAGPLGMRLRARLRLQRRRRGSNTDTLSPCTPNRHSPSE